MSSMSQPFAYSGPAVLHLPGRPPASAYLMEGGGLEIYGSGSAPWA